MIIDSLVQFCSEATVASGNVGDVIDLKKDFDMGYGDTPIVHIVLDGAGSSSTNISLVTSQTLDDGEMPSTGTKTLATFPCVANENGVVASFPFPQVPEAYRYIGITADGSATGKLSAQVLYKAGNNKIYPKV